MERDLPKLIVISGPTCSGKSKLAVDLALKVGGEIINADSMQVYRGMDVGTAKLPVEDRKGIKHHLIDILEPDQEFNAALFLSYVLPVIQDLQQKDIPIIVVGGTGLYLRALLGGLFECPPSDFEVRRGLHEEYKEKGLSALYQRLLKLDKNAAGNINPNDRIRIMRALEVINITARPFSELVGEHGFSDRRFSYQHFCMNIDRTILYERINRRTVSMIEEGLIDETKGLLDAGYSPDLKSMQSIGYRHSIHYLHGLWGLDEVIRIIQRDTRRYAKRQLTWFRAEKDVTWINPEDTEGLATKVIKFI
jgi:tRNA dimethylallyltransferase